MDKQKNRQVCTPIGHRLDERWLDKVIIVWLMKKEEKDIKMYGSAQDMLAVAGFSNFYSFLLLFSW